MRRRKPQLTAIIATATANKNMFQPKLLEPSRSEKSSMMFDGPYP